MKKPNSFLLAIFAIAVTVPTASAMWSFSITAGYSGACGSTSYSFPSIPAGRTRAECEANKGYVTTACSQLASYYACVPDYGCCTGHCSLGACTGSDEAMFDNPYFSNLIGNFGGTGGITSGIGGLGSDLGTSKPAGPEQGQASFVPHTTQANKQWNDETVRRMQSYSVRTIRARQACAGGTGSFMNPCVSAQVGRPRPTERAYNWISSHIPGGKASKEIMSPIGSLPRRRPVPTSTANYELRYLARMTQLPPKYEKAPETTTDQLAAPLPMIAPGPGEGQSLGGVGVHQGPPDKLPPPTPASPEVNRGCLDAFNCTLKCPKESPIYDAKAGKCYMGSPETKSGNVGDLIAYCDQAGNQDKPVCRQGIVSPDNPSNCIKHPENCQNKSAPLPPVRGGGNVAPQPSPKPETPPQDANPCKSGQFYNTATTMCYSSKAQCVNSSKTGDCIQKLP